MTPGQPNARRRIDVNHISWRDAVVIGVPMAALVALAFWFTLRFVQPAPPDHLVLSSGAAGATTPATANATANSSARTASRSNS